MKPQIYFMRESPDFSFMLERGRTDRIAANRVVICIMTEFGICNDRRMSSLEFSRFIESIQTVTGTINEKKEDTKKMHYRKKKSIIATIEPIGLPTLIGDTAGNISVEGSA